MGETGEPWGVPRLGLLVGGRVVPSNDSATWRSLIKLVTHDLRSEGHPSSCKVLLRGVGSTRSKKPCMSTAKAEHT